MHCRYLPDRHRRPWARSRLVMNDSKYPVAEDCMPFDDSTELEPPAIQAEELAALCVSIIQSPVLNTFYQDHYDARHSCHLEHGQRIVCPTFQSPDHPSVPNGLQSRRRYTQGCHWRGVHL